MRIVPTLFVVAMFVAISGCSWSGGKLTRPDGTTLETGDITVDPLGKDDDDEEEGDDD